MIGYKESYCSVHMFYLHLFMSPMLIILFYRRTFRILINSKFVIVNKTIHLLTLGGASSGKSTFIKQLRLHHGDGFPEAERKRLLPHIYENLADGVNIIIDNMRRLGMEYSDAQNEVRYTSHDNNLASVKVTRKSFTWQFQIWSDRDL